MNDKACLNCYHCEKGVAKHVNAEMFLQAQADGKIPEEWFVKDDSIDCADCYHCQKCYADQKAKGTSGQNEANYFVFLTNECNLRCTYCYATKKPISATKEMLDRLKVFLTEEEDKRLGAHDISIQFFGGEPTVEWNSLTQFVEEFSDYYNKLYGRKVRWGMTTNATLLNRERLEFMKKWEMIPLFSIDGRPETHDHHRKTVGGGNSHHLIPLDLILEYYPTPEIRPTITPDTVADWLADLHWFHSKGLYIVATEVAYEADWTEESLLAARQMYESLAEIYVERRRAGLPIWMKFIEDGLGFLGTQEQTGHVCGIARGVVGVDSEGKLFACQRYASFSDPSLAIGDIWKGFDEHKLAEVQDLKREYMYPDPTSGFKCDDCVAKWRCRGGCNAMNFQCTGDRKMILTNHCKFQRMWAEISLTALARTGELWGKKYKKPGTCEDQPSER